MFSSNFLNQDGSANLFSLTRGFDFLFFFFFSFFNNTDLKLIQGRENEGVGLTSSLPGTEFH